MTGSVCFLVTRDQQFQYFPRCSVRKKHLDRAGKLQSVTGIWFIIGLLDYRTSFTLYLNFGLSDFQKIFGKICEYGERQ